VILLDLKPSKVTGLEVLQLLKSEPRTRVIPVVILSSPAQDRDVTESYELGANSDLLKPLDMSGLWHKALPLTAQETYVSFSS
jgi:two-component system, response regulator